MARKVVGTKKVYRDLEQAKFIRQCLTHRAGLGIQEAADLLGVDQATMSQWANGWRRPKIDRLTQLAGVLKCEVTDLYRIMYPDVYKVVCETVKT